MSDLDFATERAATRSIHAPLPVRPAMLARRLAGDAAVDRVSCGLGDGSCATAHASAMRQSGGDVALQRSLLQLQRDYGNRYVGQVLRQAEAPPEEDEEKKVQARRRIGEPSQPEPMRPQ